MPADPDYQILETCARDAAADLVCAVADSQRTGDGVKVAVIITATLASGDVTVDVQRRTDTIYHVA